MIEEVYNVWLVYLGCFAPSIYKLSTSTSEIVKETTLRSESIYLAYCVPGAMHCTKDLIQACTHL